MPDGPLTEHLQRIRLGDTVLMRKKPTGTLVLDALLPGKRLYMLSTGTGIAPFASLVRDPETYEKFEQVVLLHGCHERAEPDYGEDLVAQTLADPLVGEVAQGRLVHYTCVTREDHPRRFRVTEAMTGGQVFADLGVPPPDPAVDRVMICGSMAMLHDSKALCEAAGLAEDSNSTPGAYVVERAFVD